jgi:two-component system, sensor histidine kinase and response regulator
MTDTAAKAKILIVDDVAGNIHMLMETLKEDYAIVAAKNGLKALQLAEAKPQPALILLDVVMPDMNGHEVCTRLKQNPNTRDIPVIFVTALGEEEDEATGLRLGAIDYIQKPFSQSIVRARVKNHLELVQARRQLEQQNQALLEAAALREDVERITRHDLKGPLNVVINAPQLLMQEACLNDEYKHMLQEVIDAGYRMLDMINRSLDLYKMESGSYKLQAQPLDLLPLLSHVIEEHSKFSAARPLSIKLDTDELDKVLIRGEELLCHSMFSNLLRNALEASPEGADVSLRVRREGDGVAVYIHNRGSVAETIRQRFFDKYVSAGKEQGTGLGTYSAALIARTLQGSISVDFSEAGATTVRVQLPLSCALQGEDSELSRSDLAQAAQLLSHPVLEQLQKLLSEGDPQALRKYLDGLQQDYPQLCILKEMRMLVDEFKLMALQQMLERMLAYAQAEPTV